MPFGQKNIAVLFMLELLSFAAEAL